MSMSASVPSQEFFDVHGPVRSFFVAILSNPAFKVVHLENYLNGSRRPGVRWSGTLNGRTVNVSESNTRVASTPSALARILAGGQIDRSKKAIYSAPKRFGTGMRIEFRYQGIWFDVSSPDEL
jgi:hypothetical protein